MGDVVAIKKANDEFFRADERRAEVLRREIASSAGPDKQNDLVQILGNAAWHALLSNQPVHSARLGEEALKLDASQTWINVNLGHAYLFLGRVDDAKKIYSATKDVHRSTEGTRKYADEIKDDFNLFRKLQMTRSEMSRIESELGI
jgi:hypothetical protein